MNWEEFAALLKNAGWNWNGNGDYFQKIGEPDNGMEYRIWGGSKRNTVIIGYGTWNQNQIGNVQEIFHQAPDTFDHGGSPGKYIVLKYKDRNNNKKIQLHQVENALKDFNVLLRNANVLPCGGTASHDPVNKLAEVPAEQPANEDKNKAPGNKLAEKQSDDDKSLSFEQVLKKIGCTPPADDFWQDKTLNPWFDFNLAEGKGNRFVLPDDESKIDGYNDELKKKVDDADDAGTKDEKQKRKFKNNLYQYEIHLNAPPQPYIGNPAEAKIWLFLMNPSYCEVDIFDLVDEDEGDNAIKSGIDKKYKAKTTKGSFGTRRTLINNQYSFRSLENLENCDCPWFYVLDKSFRKVSHCGRKPLGSYDWWNTYLLTKNICGGKKERLKDFFVLESFPYHSRSFDYSTIKPWIHSKLHFGFWVKMVTYALTKEKVLLCRGKDIADRVHKIAKLIDHGTDKIFVNVNKENDKYAELFYVGRENFVPYCQKEGNGIIDRNALNTKLEELGIIPRDDR